MSKGATRTSKISQKSIANNYKYIEFYFRAKPKPNLNPAKAQKMLSFVFRDSHTRAKFNPIRNPVSPFVFHDLFSMGTSTNTVMFQRGEREHTLRGFLVLSVDKE